MKIEKESRQIKNGDTNYERREHSLLRDKANPRMNSGNGLTKKRNLKFADADENERNGEKGKLIG